ncbi:hypothetical protein OJAV_G00119950 [Oryzias javanicus]|uniref:Transmembrane protein 119b n=1 Tax=Oryzias javanicus TaxID=123683 RepID=A0A3S2PFY8_ORYJA|nr:hypothetical protein OJAV_G00119950 [Oryzias javanicus]
MTTSSSVKTCSTRGLVNKCLIAVGALAVLATIFMVSTIVLCAKLSARKQKPRRRKESTEMICISSLLPERHHNYTRQRNPVTNGVLVFPAGGDSDEDGGDNLTLSSFLPESKVHQAVACRAWFPIKSKGISAQTLPSSSLNDTMLLLASLCVVLCVSCSLATPTTFYSRLEGSTDEEELMNSNSFMPTTVPSTEHRASPTEAAGAEQDVLRDMLDFLERNVLLILVITALVLLVFLIICGALLMSHRRKVNSYYPASFPSKMYVDDRDKTGGARSFNEVQGKAASEHESTPVDSHKQLQADIMRAAKSLRAASKSTDATEKGEPCQQEADPASEDVSKSNSSILDQELPSVPEEKEPCELSDSGAAEGPQLELRPGDQHSQEPAADGNLRPASLHIHNDSATLQLLAGEKTAF